MKNIFEKYIFFLLKENLFLKSILDESEDYLETRVCAKENTRKSFFFFHFFSKSAWAQVSVDLLPEYLSSSITSKKRHITLILRLVSKKFYAFEKKIDCLMYD